MDINKVNGVKSFETTQNISTQKQAENNDLLFASNFPEKPAGVSKNDVIKVPNVGTDVRTKYINPKNPKEILTMNQIALILLKDGPEELNDVQGLKITKTMTGKHSMMYSFDDFIIEIDKGNNIANVSYFDEQNMIKMFRYSQQHLENTITSIREKAASKLLVK